MADLDRSDLHAILDDALIVLEELCYDSFDSDDISCEEDDDLCGEEWCARVGCLAEKIERVRAARGALGLTENV